METKTLSQVWRKLWPAVMIAEGASEEEEHLAGFVFTTKTVHGVVSML